MIRIDLFTFFISEIFHSCIIVQAIALPLSMEWSRRGKKFDLHNNNNELKYFFNFSGSKNQ